jgi:hypothetical protein
VQRGHIVGRRALITTQSGSWPAAPLALGLGGGIADVVDLVEDAEARHLVGADFGQHLSVTASWRSKPGSLASMTWSSSAASSASSSVDLNEATRPCGRFLMKPTVSLTSTRGTLSG